MIDGLRTTRLASAVLLPVAFGLASCGGGEDIEEAVDKALGRVAWTTIASEGQTFTFNVAGTYTVRFGANGVWAQKSIVNSGPCSVANFGSDPAPGVLKTCQVKGKAAVTVTGTASLTSGGTSTSTSTATATATWTEFAKEGSIFSTTASSATVRYGTSTQFVEKIVSGSSLLCGSALFGSDPAPGVSKNCWIQDPASVSVAAWTKFADEAQSFTTSKAVNIRYGTSTLFLERTVTGSGQCSAAFFGSDPAAGAVKDCKTQETAALSLSTTSTTTSSASSVTSSGTASADGTVVAALTATRSTGPAPLAVLFDATGSTVSNGIAFHGLKYDFDFGDERGQTWAVSGLPKNKQTGGPIAAHVFDVPGTYTVKVTVSSSSGAVSTAQVSITVQDPNAVFSGLSTICVSAVGDYSGCPGGATTTTALPTSFGGKRVLLRRGESFAAISIPHRDDNVQVGAFGAGTKPIVQSISISNGHAPAAGVYADDIAIMDLSIRSSITQYNPIARFLLYRNDLYTTGLNTGILFGHALGWYVRNGTFPAETYYQPREIFIVENSVIGTTTQANPLLLIQGGGSRVGIMGNDLKSQPEHNIRLWMLHKGFIAHNSLAGQSSDGIRHSLKLHSGGLRNYSDTMDITGWSAGTNGVVASSQIVISNNLFGSALDNNQWTVTVQPQNNIQVEGLEDVIVENNRFIRGSRTNNDLMLQGRRMSARGNSRVDGLDTKIGFYNSSVIPPEWNGPYWVSSSWTIAGVTAAGDLELMPPTAAVSRLEWVSRNDENTSPLLELFADSVVSSTANGINYQIELSEDAIADMEVTLSNGTSVVIKAGTRSGSTLAPVPGLVQGINSQSFQVFVVRVIGGNLPRLAINDANVITKVEVMP
jgi:hypothetical protein